MVRSRGSSVFQCYGNRNHGCFPLDQKIHLFVLPELSSGEWNTCPFSGIATKEANLPRYIHISKHFLARIPVPFYIAPTISGIFSQMFHIFEIQQVLDSLKNFPGISHTICLLFKVLVFLHRVKSTS